MSLEEGRHSGEFILSMANGNLSVDNGTLIVGENLVAGTVLAQIEPDNWLQVIPASSSTENVAAGILLGAVDATSAAKACAVIVRDAEVIGAAFVWPDGIIDPQKATAIAQLEALHIKVR